MCTIGIWPRKLFSIAIFLLSLCVEADAEFAFIYNPFPSPNRLPFKQSKWHENNCSLADFGQYSMYSGIGNIADVRNS